MSGTIPEDGPLREVLEIAVGIVRRDARAPVPIPSPPQLARFISWSRLPPAALVAARKALDSDDDLRRRVAAEVTEGDVGRAGWLLVHRPEGWDSELDELLDEWRRSVEDNSTGRSQRAAQRQLAAAREAADRAAAELDTERSRVAAAHDELRRERRSRSAAETERDDLRSSLEGALTRLAHRDERVRSLEDRLEAVTARAAEAEADLSRLRMLERRLAESRAALGELVPALSDLYALCDDLGSAPHVAAEPKALPDETPGAVPPPDGGSGVRPPAARTAVRRSPVRLRRGVVSGSVEEVEQLLAVPGILVLVDGYNVSKRLWPELSPPTQRSALLRALEGVFRRFGAETVVVFDGVGAGGSPASSGSLTPGVRVRFSPGETEADDVIIATTAATPVTRPVLVVSGDRRVQQGVAGHGANWVSNDQLIALLLG